MGCTSARVHRSSVLEQGAGPWWTGVHCAVVRALDWPVRKVVFAATIVGHRRILLDARALQRVDSVSRARTTQSVHCNARVIVSYAL